MFLLKVGLSIAVLLMRMPSASPAVAPTEFPDCLRFYHAACSEALGAWLPTFGEAADPWRRDQATRITRRDGFVYENEKPRTADFLGFNGPSDGTFFVYGSAGPPKGHVVYDARHHIAFYQQGCCGGSDVVAAAGVSAPPKRLVDKDLTNLHTVRGVRLGMHAIDVMKIYGPSALIDVTGHSDLKMLAYTTWPPSKTIVMVHGPCGQFQDFYFKQDRLILIQLGNGC